MLRYNVEQVLFSVAEARHYIEHHYDWIVTRQTIYNWIEKGRRGNTLQYLRKNGQTFIKKEWIDEFVSNAQ